AKFEAEDREPVRDLKSEDFSTKPEAQTSEPVKTLARPLVSEAARPREPVRDLKSVLFSARPEAEDSAPVRDLKSEDFSARLEAKVTVPVRNWLYLQAGVITSLALETVVMVSVAAPLPVDPVGLIQTSTVR